MGRLTGIAAVGVVLLVVLFVAIFGGGGTAGADAPVGGCSGRGGGPPATTGPGSGASGGTQKDAVLNDAQMAVARTVVAVGKGLRVTKRGTAIALGTAMQESTMDPNAKNGRSEGLYQQQGALYADVNRTDPADTSQAFYRQLLARVPQYDNPDPAHGGIAYADAAQEVQRSGAGPSYYARWERWATTLAQELYDGTPPTGGTGGSGGAGGGGEVKCRPGGGSGPVSVSINGLTVQVETDGKTHQFTFLDQRALTAAAAALSYLGTTYAWGGGGPNGPTKGKRDGGPGDAHGDYDKGGFDCSGLMQYAYAQAGIDLPRVAADQQKVGSKHPYDIAAPGDLLFYGTPAHHVALYLGEEAGGAYMVEAPKSGDVVKISPVRTAPDTEFAATVVRPY